MQKKAIPGNIPELLIPSEFETLGNIVPLLSDAGFVASKSEFIRLIKQGGVQINGEKISIELISTTIHSGDILKIGKKKFVRFSGRV